MKPLFITFEGGDGSGKSSQILLLSEWMQKRNIEHVLTKEPGNQHINECRLIREILLNPDNTLTPNAELFLFLADRSEHVSKFILPSLEAGKNVICDRFIDSTIVYQCARGISRNKIETLINMATNGLKPDLTFVLDVPTKIALQRAKKNSKYEDGDRMEKAGERFHDDVRHGFLKLAESLMEQDRIKVINAAPPKTIKEIHLEIVNYVSKALWIPKAGEIND